MRLTIEQLELLTPERLKALSLEEKREALMLLEALQIPRLERLRRAIEKKNPEKQKTGSTLSEAVERARKHIAAMTPEEYATYQAERDKELQALCQWRDEKAQKLGREQRADIKAEWRKLRETNPRAGGAGVDALLGVETPAGPAQECDAERERKALEVSETPLPVSRLPKPASIAAEQEAFAVASRDDSFIGRLCGEGSDKPSGRPKGWMD